MLHELDPQPGMRVLEIGTGTGWNAALLAELVGPHNVTTIEVDPAVAEAARQRLTAARFADVTLITGDGLLGWPPAAPYRRVLATVGVDAVPYQWIEQVSAGGRLVLPLTNPYQAPGVAVLADTVWAPSGGWPDRRRSWPSANSGSTGFARSATRPPLIIDRSPSCTRGGSSATGMRRPSSGNACARSSHRLPPRLTPCNKPGGVGCSTRSRMFTDAGVDAGKPAVGDWTGGSIVTVSESNWPDKPKPSWPTVRHLSGWGRWPGTRSGESCRKASALPNVHREVRDP
ncbi:MAG: methyltransferase domain-containing protein [Actinomycetota bacterium]|nr:methyltransferase domain-containing protein [Actinomycetota bacterium]